MAITFRYDDCINALFLVLVIIVTWDTKKVNNEITGEISLNYRSRKATLKDLKNKFLKSLLIKILKSIVIP